ILDDKADEWRNYAICCICRDTVKQGGIEMAFKILDIKLVEAGENSDTDVNNKRLRIEKMKKESLDKFVVQNKEVRELFEFLNPTLKLLRRQTLGGRILNKEVKRLEDNMILASKFDPLEPLDDDSLYLPENITSILLDKIKAHLHEVLHGFGYFVEFWKRYEDLKFGQQIVFEFWSWATPTAKELAFVAQKIFGICINAASYKKALNMSKLRASITYQHQLDDKELCNSEEKSKGELSSDIEKLSSDIEEQLSNKKD
ncbi:464_t:CDS:2, partial [Scutellospora calospora]